MQISREDWILLLLFAGGNRRKYNEPVSGRTRLMKELFLLGQWATEVEDFFEFRRYKFGPYSHEVLRSLDRFIESGIVQVTSGYGGEIYSLTPDGVTYASSLYEKLDKRLRHKLVDVKIRYNHMPLPELLDHVYEEYPYYASESEYEGSVPE